MQMQNLPQEIQNMIFYYTSSPTAQIIRHLLNVYDDYYDGFTYFNYFFRYQILKVKKPYYLQRGRIIEIKYEHYLQSKKNKKLSEKSHQLAKLIAPLIIDNYRCSQYYDDVVYESAYLEYVFSEYNTHKQLLKNEEDESYYESWKRGVEEEEYRSHWAYRTYC